jgi:hypothetical protein
MLVGGQGTEFLPRWREAVKHGECWSQREAKSAFRRVVEHETDRQEPG